MEHRELEALCQRLNAPGSALRSAPFWGWNSRMDQAELAAQLRESAGAPIVGEPTSGKGYSQITFPLLNGPYLSEEWMEDVSVCVDEAEKAGLELWIYDEDKWPSGSAGGMVAAADPAQNTAKALTLEAVPCSDTPNLGEDVVMTCRVELDGQTISRFGSGDTLLVLRQERSGTSEWYSGSAPSDNLSAGAVKEFITLTHEKYRARFSQRFGSTVKGFFTDEPNFCDFFSQFTQGRPWLPWTEDFAE